MQGTRDDSGADPALALAPPLGLTALCDGTVPLPSESTSTASFPSETLSHALARTGSSAAERPTFDPVALPDPSLDPALASDLPLELPTPSAHFHPHVPAPAPHATRPTLQDAQEQIAALGTLNEDADAALVANRAYQQALLAATARLERVRERAVVLKTIVASLAADLRAPPTTSNGSTHELRLRAPGMLEPAVPYFKVMYGKDLPPNEDGMARERYLAAIQARSWHAAERKKLRKEVVAQNHRLVAQEALQRGEDPTAALAERKAADPEWFTLNTAGIDWDKVALVMERRTPAACRIQWLARDHPGVNRAQKWTPAERERLYEIVKRVGADTQGGWVEVARELGTGRTPTMCAQQWRKRPTERIVWGEEDDKKLKAAVQQWGENWDVVARHTGHAANQCMHRYLHSLLPGLARGRFTPQEDAAVVAAVGVFGTRNWPAVAARLGGRSETQCRERWSKSLDPRIHVKGSKDWTEEEDALVLRLHDDEGLGWAEISQRAFDGHRSAAHVVRRYEALQAKVDRLGPASAPKAKKKRTVKVEPPKKKRGRPRKVPLEGEGPAPVKRGAKRRKTG